MSDSGPPKHWPFEVYDPADFKVSERVATVIRVVTHEYEDEKQALAERINENAIHYGWQGITNHFVIDNLGNICTGRPLEEVPMISETETDRRMILILSAKTELAQNSLQALCQSIIDASALVRREIVVSHV